MARKILSPPAEILVYTGSGYQLVTVQDFGPEGQFAVTLANGTVLIIDLNTIEYSDFWVDTASGPQLISIPTIWVPDTGTAAHMRLTLSHELGFNMAVEKVKANLAYDYFVPELAYAKFNVGYNAFQFTTDHSKFTVDYGMGILQIKYPKFDYAYAIGQLTQKTRFVNFSHLMQELTIFHIGTGFRYNLYDTWEPVPFELSFDTGVLQNAIAYSDYSYDIGVLTQKHKYVNYRYNMGVLTQKTRPLDFKFTTEQITLQDGCKFTLDYAVKDWDEYGLTLGWAAEAPDYSFFNLSNLTVRAAYPFIDLAYDSSWPQGLRFFSLGYVVERHLTKGVEIVFPHSLQKGFDAVWGLAHIVTSGSDTGVPLRPIVTSGVDLVLDADQVVAGVVISNILGFTIRQEAIIEFPSTQDIRNGVIGAFPMRELVLSGVDVEYDLSTTNKLLKQFLVSFGLVDMATVQVTSNLNVTINGETVEIVEGSVYTDEGNYAWTGQFTLAKAEQLPLFTPNELFEITIGAETYVFLVESKALSRNQVGIVEATVMGMSPTVQLTAPRAMPVTKTWDTSSTARTIVEELVDGYPMQWQILDWAIPAYRFGIERRSPIDAINEIVGAAGGVLDCTPDGVLVVRYKFPDSVLGYGPLIKDMSYTEAQDIFSIREEFKPQREYNKFRVMDAQSSSGVDRTEFKELSATTGEVRVYPVPWREDFVLSASSTVFIGPRTYELRTEEQTVEFVNGVANTNYPVTSIDSIEWMERNLLGVVGGDDNSQISSTHPTEKYSLAKVVYKTRCFVYPVEGQAGQQIQFLVENP